MIFEAARNSDQTEGRGRMVGFDWFDNLEDAVKAVQNQGVMGYGPGDVYLLTIATTADEIKKQRGVVTRKWVYGRSWANGNGGKILYAPGFDPQEKDPDYAEYIRLRERFEKS